MTFLRFKRRRILSKTLRSKLTILYLYYTKNLLKFLLLPNLHAAKDNTAEYCYYEFCNIGARSVMIVCLSFSAYII
jgi:hypothetical protein